MPLLFIDYSNRVVRAYEEKRDANLLSRLLMHPTTANIRQECLNVYNERINKGEKEEENILKAFFGVPPVGKNFGYIIERHHPDRFRPLQSFVKGEIRNPALVTVELLAWLIDFNPRPLAYAQRLFGVTNELNIPDSQKPGYGERPSNVDQEELNVAQPEEAPSGTITAENLYEGVRDRNSITGDKDAGKVSTTNSSSNSQKRRLKIAAVISLTIAILFGGMYVIEKSYGSTNSDCMYWVNDHYEKVPCIEDPKGRLIIALDEERLDNFQMITRADTITERSIGKIYYLKNGGKIEYFTAGGMHPVYVNRTLKVLSVYMFDNYLRKKEPPGKDSLAEQNMKSITNK